MLDKRLIDVISNCLNGGQLSDNHPIGATCELSTSVPGILNF